MILAMVTECLVLPLVRNLKHESENALGLSVVSRALLGNETRINVLEDDWGMLVRKSFLSQNLCR